MDYRTEIEGLIVSTVLTPDMGWETAVLDVHRAHPVERYGSDDAAKLGHERWCRWVADRQHTTVHQLGWFLHEQDFELTRFETKPN